MRRPRTASERAVLNPSLSDDEVVAVRLSLGQQVLTFSLAGACIGLVAGMMQNAVTVIVAALIFAGWVIVAMTELATRRASR